MTLTIRQKQIIGHVLGALVNVLVMLYVKDEAAQMAALGVWASIASALHIPRPQDSTPAQAEDSAKTAVFLARKTNETADTIADTVAK